MTLGVAFGNLNRDCQYVILQRVGVWLQYRDIKQLVKSFNAVPGDKDNLKSFTTEMGFLNVIFSGFANDKPRLERHLTERLLEVLETEDRKVSLGILSRLMEYEVPSYVWGVAFRSAAKNGHDAVVVKIMESENLSSLGMETALKDASINGHLKVVRVLLGKFQSSPFYRGWSVVEAAWKGFYQVVSELLKYGAISPKDRGEALYCVIRSRNERSKHPMVLELLKDGAPISDTHRALSVVSAAEQGLVKILQELLKNNPVIMGKCLERALYYASDKGNPEMVACLLRAKKFFSQDVGWALYAATQNGHRAVVQLLQQYDPEAAKTVPLQFIRHLS